MRTMLLRSFSLLLLFSSLAAEAAPVRAIKGSVSHYRFYAAPGAVDGGALTCGGRVVNWSQGGSNCAAQSGTGTDGQSKTVSSTASGTLGSATITCNAASNAFTVAGGSSCSPADCTSQTVSWTQGGATCAATTGVANNGSSRSLASTNGNTGAANATCNSQSNTWTVAGGGSCAAPPPPTCTDQGVSWSQGGHSCTAQSGTMSDGSNKTVSNNAAGKLGSATITCAGAPDTYTVSGGSCYPADCTSQTVSWSQSGQTCAANTGTANNGASKALSSTNGNTGSAMVSCDSQSNTWTVTGGTSCAAPAPTTCSSQTVNWSQGGSNCAALSGTTNDGASKTISSTNANLGSVTIACTAAGDSYAQSGALCYPADCTAQTVSWSQGGTTCSAAATVTNNGAAKSLSSTNGNTGSATATCDSRTNVYTVSGGTCAPPPPTTCSSQTVSWTQGGSNCAALSGTTNDGASKTISSTNANLGSVTIACTAAGDSYAQSGASCYRPDCTSQTVSWSQGGTTCAANTGTTNNGSSKSLSSTNGNTGSATATCDSQSNLYNVSGGSCTAPPASCGSQLVSWTVSGSTCSGTASGTGHGQTTTVSATSGTGNASFQCSNGAFAQSGAATCSAASGSEQHTTFRLSASQDRYSSGLTAGGNWKIWGRYDGSNNYYTTPTDIDPGTTYTFLGYSQPWTACGITSDQTLKCRSVVSGSGDSPASGDGTTISRHNPVVIMPGTKFSYTEVNYAYPDTQGKSALAVDGTWYRWGSSSPTPANTDSARKYKKIFQTCGITMLDQLACYGSIPGDGSSSASSPVIADASVTYKFIGGSFGLYCGITMAGVGKCWDKAGLNAANQRVPTALPGSLKIKWIETVQLFDFVNCGFNGIYALADDDKLYRYPVDTGPNCEISIAAPVLVSGAVTFATPHSSQRPAGAYIATFIGTDGKAYSYDSYNNLFKLEDGSTSYKELAASASAFIGVTTTGILRTWGLNDMGQLGRGTTGDSSTTYSPADVQNGY